MCVLNTVYVDDVLYVHCALISSYVCGGAYIMISLPTHSRCRGGVGRGGAMDGLHGNPDRRGCCSGPDHCSTAAGASSETSHTHTHTHTLLQSNIMVQCFSKTLVIQ